MTFEKHASGVAKGGLTTGIIGTSLGALALLGTGANGIGSLLGGARTAGTGVGQAYLDGMFMSAMMGGWGAPARSAGSCESDHFVTRYDADKDAQISKLESELALREANDRMQNENLKLYQYVDGRLRAIEQQIASQAVVNQATSDKIQLAAQEAACCCQKQTMALEAERAARCCGDNAIVNYANATFYPQMIADITVGSTATPQHTWNPVGNCGCNG